MYLGAFGAILVLTAAVMTGFTSQDDSGDSASAPARQGRMEALSSAQADHLQTYVYWPIWRSGS